MTMLENELEIGPISIPISNGTPGFTCLRTRNVIKCCLEETSKESDIWGGFYATEYIYPYSRHRL